ncbi:MAG: hypothetical protein V4591_03095 [Bdellovibrionota bacterium]
MVDQAIFVRESMIKAIFIFLSLLGANFVSAWQQNFDKMDSFSGHCSLQRGSPNLKLNFSQKLDQNSEQKNEFLVGWSFMDHHNYNHTQKPELGGDVVVVRCLPPGHYAMIAKGQVENLNGGMIEARVYTTNYDEPVLGKQTQNLVESRNLVWRPMVGDEVIPIYNQVAKIKIISPKFQLSTNELFIKQEDGLYSLALSDDGKNLLREKFEHFKNRNGRLLVEGFILTSGNTEKLRLDSLMRAQTVSTFLIREYSLQPSQVVSIGYGNDWLQTGMQPVGSYPFVEEGVVLKIL